MSTQQGRIYSINISTVKGVSKKPVSTANLITDYGLEGDVHAGDKVRQVSLLSLESIKRQKECPRINKNNKSLELKPGDFAENITTEGIDLAKIKEGDRMAVGKGVLLEVVRIGKECYRRCSIYYKIGDCIMPKEGVFARVLKGGVIQVGDLLEITNG
ncbi:MAG: MOSC domain-containing protein [Candidatus Omnitrophota bacterium]